MTADSAYLILPGFAGDAGRKAVLRVVDEDADRELLDLTVHSGDREPDFFFSFPLKEYQGCRLGLYAEEESLLSMVRTSPEKAAAPVQRGKNFTSPSGWMNDPNGCFFDHGIWHLYFQHNPAGTLWGNMTWGHAVSRDGLHFAFDTDVLFPTQKRMKFSGCALMQAGPCLGLPKDAVLYFYTDAAVQERDRNVQRIAYSLDGGWTLREYPEIALPPITKENRDPKVFFHAPTGAYIMVLYLTGWQFGIFRSEDLLHWERTQVLDMDQGMWECPDLFPLSVTENGVKTTKWFFTSADGSYYAGDFNGYTFQREGKRRFLYGTSLPYAGQTFAGTGERVFAIAWLRTSHFGTCFEGAMSRIREYHPGRDADGWYIRQSFFTGPGSDAPVPQGSRILERITADGACYLADQLTVHPE